MMEKCPEVDTAKNLISVKDYIGARSKLLQVAKHFLALDDISAMVTVCDVLCAANLDFLDSQVDWYSVLQVFPSADASLIESQYNKLRVLLKPMCYHFPDAEYALRLVQKAFSMLSDPAKRSAFDLKRAASLESDRFLPSPDTGINHPCRNEPSGYCLVEASDMPSASVSSAGIPTQTTRSYSNAESDGLEQSEATFFPGQIWAVYDGDDFMPRKYALVHNKSANGVCVSVLDPYPLLPNEINWIAKKLPYVCGMFEINETSVNLRISQLSHKVKHEAVAENSFYQIYPRKGQVWAMYKHQRGRWKQAEFTSCQYEIVEITTEISCELELVVVRLEEVPGFTSFFRRQTCNGYEQICKVPREEFLRFSHQIRAFKIRGGNCKIPEGCCQLEVDSLPHNLVSRYYLM